MNDMTAGFEWKRFWCAEGASIFPMEDISPILNRCGDGTLIRT